MMNELRIAGTEDVDQFVSLSSQTFKEAYGDVHTPEDLGLYCESNFTLQFARDELSNPKTICRIGFREREPRGYYVVKHQNCPIPLNAESSEIKRLYILSAEYGSGLGRSLYEHAIESARAAGSGWIWLSVSDINYRAQRFYKNLGFEPLGSGAVLVVGSDRLSSTIMARQLE